MHSASSWPPLRSGEGSLPSMWRWLRRDAIVTEMPSPVRPVVRCAALFPLTMEETQAFEADSQLYRSLDRLGIGALPFLPGNTFLAAEWLDRLLGLPSDELAWNGLPGPQAVMPGS